MSGLIFNLVTSSGSSGPAHIVQIPTVTVGSYIYNGEAQGPEVTGLDADNVTVTGATGVDAGTYRLVLSLKDKKKAVWSDNTTADIVKEYNITKAAGSITLSANNVSFDSDTKTATVTASGYQGSLSASSTDTTIATVAVNGNAITINSVNDKSGSASINLTSTGDKNHLGGSAVITVTAQFAIVVQVPTVTVGTYTYNGSAQGPSVTGRDTANTTISKATATHAGNYTLTIALKDKTKMVWSTGGTDNISKSWSIEKASSSITLSKTSVALNNSNNNVLVAAYNYYGNLAVPASTNTDVAYVKMYTPGALTIYGVSTGTAMIIVVSSGDTDHYGATAIISVTCSMVK